MGSTHNFTKTRTDAALEALALDIRDATSTPTDRVYGIINLARDVPDPTVVGFADLGLALGEFADDDTRELAQQRGLVIPNARAALRFRENLVDKDVATWYTPDVATAKEAVPEMTRAAHAHRFRVGLAATKYPDATYYWNLPVEERAQRVPRREYHIEQSYWEEVERDRVEAQQGFLNAETVSDALRAVPRVSQYDLDLMLVDSNRALPLVIVERTTRTKRRDGGTDNAALALARVLDTPILYVFWEVRTRVVARGEQTSETFIRAKVCHDSQPLAVSVPESALVSTIARWIDTRTFAPSVPLAV